MSLFCLKTHDLSWQDRTINIELMIAPARSQLLFNKHKGLKTKYDQVSHNLDREKDSYMRSYKTDQRLMERKKNVYSKRRNDIIQRRAITDYLGRRRSSLPATPLSAPPLTGHQEGMFITALPTRESQSAGPRIHFQSQPTSARSPTPERPSKLMPPVTPDMRLMSACSTTRSVTPGKPFLKREKSVRFQRINTDLVEDNVCEHIHSRIAFNVPIEDRIQQFLDKQHNFNTNPIPPLPRLSQDLTANGKPPLSRTSTLQHLNLVNLENAFDEFCVEDSTDGFEKLVKYATKMKASARNKRNSMIDPSV